MIGPQSQIELSHAFERLLEERRDAERLRRDLIYYWHTLILEAKKRTKELERAFYQAENCGDTPFSSEETIVPGTPDTITALAGLSRLPSPLTPVTSKGAKSPFRLDNLSTERIQKKLEGLLKRYQGIINFSKGNSGKE
ncbi:56a539f5-010a-4b65-b6d9-0d7b99a6d59f-CDS [Sclerotinia trifoliorum]|uniref:56a539f5-010a-4b65-b6d9-0d7b99a6d59f-CDS n=1 Tax=Sclerotinia trifoliorum TaxID=28548 RepID=A0A8H2W085_9HELO|nr:56a539f5-010a-4b65-b6d9-0d7b99a6d59f-CDS [Sclerotinia trifoliorum]